eukprot:1958977-Pleurochrysis_carterae.AAC.2
MGTRNRRAVESVTAMRDATQTAPTVLPAPQQPSKNGTLRCMPRAVEEQMAIRSSERARRM